MSFKGGAPQELERSAGTIFGLTADLRLAYTNPAWKRFAADNGASAAFWTRWQLGASMVDAFPSVLRDYFESAYRQCLKDGKPWEHTYECSSPTTFCIFHHIVYPLDGRGLLVVNSTVASRLWGENDLRSFELEDVALPQNDAQVQLSYAAA